MKRVIAPGTRWICCLLVLGALLAGAAGTALINPYRFVGLGDRIWLWCVLAVAGFGLIGVASVLLAKAQHGIWSRLLVVCAGCTVLAGVACISWSYLITLSIDYSNEQRVATVSPDGKFAVILNYAHPQYSHAADRPDGLYLQTRDGFFSKRAYIGCLSDSGAHRMDAVWFAGANTIVVRQEGDEGKTERSVSFDPVKVRVDQPMGDSCPPTLYTG
ncbi:hypothetical protein [Actinomadura montaniterrae]|uniref:Uncharacterized protein n=1 Tax=Actinomadura montaniterrae TaxID=1803903 RepID=A0A6L3VTI1_9ACTN|nr:hypothetical protein [Actinomadura montaniterrae]KAB2378961.1 hypothetical protein F9B16_22610 [Actinomadura montaniterrae]